METPTTISRLLTERDKIRPIRKIVGMALKWPAHDLYQAAGTPRPDAMPKEISKVLSNEALSKNYDKVSESIFLIRKGVEDIQTILTNSLLVRSEQEAIMFSRHPETIRSIAIFALRSGTFLEDFISPEHREKPDAIGAQSGDSFTTEIIPSASKEGCPFAGSNGEINIDPFFERFVPWAANLCIASLSAHASLVK